MTKSDEHAAALRELERILAYAGADPSRWPDGAADRLAPLLASDRIAQGMLADAQGLDRLLDTPAGSIGGRDGDLALIRRIMAEVAGSAAVAGTEAPVGRVIPFPSGARPGAAAPAEGPRRTLARSALVQGMAMMAASLIAGFFIGTSGDVASAFQDAAVAVGISAESEGIQITFDDAIAGGDEGWL